MVLNADLRLCVIHPWTGFLELSQSKSSYFANPQVEHFNIFIMMSELKYMHGKYLGVQITSASCNNNTKVHMYTVIDVSGLHLRITYVLSVNICNPPLSAWLVQTQFSLFSFVLRV